MAEPLLKLLNISKRFPGVKALDGVSLDVLPGEVVALIGENGAGKSTLMKILGGVHQADSGDILIAGRSVKITSTADAMACGIGFIHQELNVLDNLDVAGNIFLGRERLRLGPLKIIDLKRMRRECEPYLRRVGLNISPRTLLKDLSLAQKQMVEIAKALSQNTRLLIMDEPTSCLTLTETARLLAAIKELRQQGVSIIYISHRLGEVQQCADRVVVLRDGKNAGHLSRDEIEYGKMVRLMVGRELRDLYVPSFNRQAAAGGLTVRNLQTSRHPGKPLQFVANRGEILGFAGLVGAGRSEMAQAIFGIDPPLQGKLLLDGEPLVIRSPQQAVAAGVYLIPEDRRRSGLVTDMSVRENMTLGDLPRYATAGIVRRFAERSVAARQMQTLNIKTASMETPARNLSGGNQQKVILAKWLSLKPQVLIFDEPTRGIDVGAKAEIYRLIRQLADSGVVIIMISSDMEEVLGVSDRIAVMHEGAISGFLSRAAFSEESIMRLATGQTISKQTPSEESA